MSIEERLKSFDDRLDKHFVEDRDFQKKSVETDIEIKESIKRIENFMSSLQGLADVFKGASLLRKPAVVVLGLVLGIVALSGGLKTLLAGVLAWVTGK